MFRCAPAAQCRETEALIRSNEPARAFTLSAALEEETQRVLEAVRQLVAP